MINFHAVMSFMGMEEFGVSFQAASREAAYDYLREQYPESSCVQLESPEDRDARQKRIYDEALLEEGEWDFDEEWLNEDVQLIEEGY